MAESYQHLYNPHNQAPVWRLVLEGELEGVEMKAQEVLLTEKKRNVIVKFSVPK
jgi:hypothetical protein